MVVGGVAGGASTAARLRRLDEASQIDMYERGQYVSFANCGLPYRVGQVITSDAALLLVEPAAFHDRFRINVHINSQVTGIDTMAKTITVLDRSSARERVEPYDKLVLATGGKAIRPQVAGIDLPGIYTVKTIPETRQITKWLEQLKVKQGTRSVVVVGGGFIGMEMAENLHGLGLHVTILEKAPQVMTTLDPELAHPLEQRLRERGLTLVLNDGLACFSASADGPSITVHSEAGKELKTDMVILAIGVVPENDLARAAGLELTSQGGIKVDDYMCTSDPNIYAVGDVIASRNNVTKGLGVLPLAGPANRQGRIAAAAIADRGSKPFRGTQGTAICGAFGLTVATTGANERALRMAGIDDFEAIRLHPTHHVGE